MIPDSLAPYIGLPYLKDGATRDGTNCWGLFSMLQREVCGVDLSDYDGPIFAARTDASAIGEAARRFASRFREIPAGEEQFGDAILLRMLGEPMHIGFVVAPGVMLHIEESSDSVIERYDTRIWERRIIAFYRAEEK